MKATYLYMLFLWYRWLESVDSEILKCDHSKMKYTEQIVPVLCLFIML